MSERKKKLTIQDRAKVFLTPVSTYNLFPEIKEDIFLGKKPEQISYNVTKLILTHPLEGISERRGVAWDEDGHTVLVSTKREGMEMISLALQLQGFVEAGIETVSGDTEQTKYLKLVRQEPLYVENGVLMQRSPGGPPWEKIY